MDCSPPGSSVYGISQARIPECVAIPFSRVSFGLKDQTQVSRIAGRFFTVWASREAQVNLNKHYLYEVKLLYIYCVFFKGLSENSGKQLWIKSGAFRGLLKTLYYSAEEQIWTIKLLYK